MSPSGDVACVQENTHGSNDHQISPRSFARIECPSLTQILSELAPPSPALTFAATQSLPSEEQKVLFDSLRSSLKGAEEHGGLECFEAIPSILRTLWECKSLYLAPAAEALANGSRNAPWRVAYGQAGILDFFLQLIASKASVDDKLLLHAFRLIGNSCADTNENRDRVVKSNYTSAIVQHSSNLELIQVVIPVLYNTCIDYAPAQAQLGANKLLYVLLKLVKDGTLKGREALVDYVFELIELIGEQALTQACLKTNQVLAEISASDSFADFYPIESPLIQTLKAWMTSREDQLQICSCVMLGNLARSDAVCEKMVRDFNIHQDLISILRSDANAAVLHSALGYLKNLAIAGDNRLIFGETGIISSISRLWQYDSVPQVQLAATSITRQVIISTIENISRLLEELPEEGDDLTPKRTYLSLLLKLFRKTDSTPIKTEIGRIVTSVCRTLVPKSREQDLAANDLLERVFDLHEDVALPVGAMVTQSQWPVVRSEGWFALALMASSNAGSAAVSRCLPDMGILPLIEQTLDVEFPEPTDETEATQLDKDRGNIVVLLQEILKNDLAVDGDEDNGKTAEMQMLEISRQEVQKTIAEDARGLKRLFQSLFVFGYHYIYDPVATGFRFIHLVIIFLPVILAAPSVCFGRPSKDHERVRTGTLWWYNFLVKSMERAGPAFIKLGQWAASRTDIFPPELCEILSFLHSNAPAHSLRQTKKTIRKAFNWLPFEDIFEEFHEEPLGVGAIAQVYKAKLKPNLMGTSNDSFDTHSYRLRDKVRKNVGALVKSSPQRVPSSYVAIKVLHPRVEHVIHRDLKIMSFFASLINAIPTMNWLSLPDEVYQFGEMMKLQLDLRIEATNLVNFREKFRTRTTAWFPYPYLDYSTREVLVEEFAQGIPLSTFLDMGGGVYQEEIANEGLDAFLHMLLIDNFVHADLHPGNIMVRFYRPSELGLSLGNKSRASDAPTAAEVDVMESVLARLHPHVNNRRDWQKTLDGLNADGYRPQLIFIDTGLVTQLNELNRLNFIDLFRAIAEFDGFRAGELMVERCRQPEAVIDPYYFALGMEHLVLSVKSRTFALGNVKIGDVLSEVLTLVRKHHVRLEGDFVNVVISCLLLEGIGRNLDPNLDLFKSSLPILRKLGSNTTSLKSVRSGDLSMLRVWVGLEARGLLQSSIESVEHTCTERGTFATRKPRVLQSAQSHAAIPRQTTATRFESRPNPSLLLLFDSLRVRLHHGLLLG
ncbi:ubiquinone biosynthesis protein [Aspergillus heteromorphus CBS 117.55]|uniref:Ubiquinone biosynthesis protein n=1 Tax=Aspergillus heteromorphus CBS 117.55 TaxID=1448321 RepID=A0A317UXL7_9EURO|nr:ubiquinone biosynthesis protein [Aspergillus heteromorphus CBS 117.55]PWY64740.1 ubiquinone biosynthesis protein [Aspergillus heteromorphus CBS 117.55]